MDIKQRLTQVIDQAEKEGGTFIDVIVLCRDALARIRELEGAPDIKARLQLEKAKHAKIGHRLERIAQALEGLAEQLAADRRRL